MAKLLPEISPDQIENRAERLFATELVDQLPSKITIFHGIRWLSENRYGNLREGESDFVILDPDHGLLFIEVKGGTVETEGEKWIRNKSNGITETIQDPVAQVTKSMYELVDRACHQLNYTRANFPGTYGYALAIPECRISGHLPANLKHDILIDAEKCKDLRATIEKAFDRWKHPHNRPLNQKELEAIRLAICPQFDFIPILWRKVEDQEKRLKQLTLEKKAFLNFIEDHRMALIQGVAGSGKTILALSKAQELARKGLRTLFLCYNNHSKIGLKQSHLLILKRVFYLKTIIA